MKSRERVIAAIKHQGLDRVPYDFWAERPTLARLRQATGQRDLERLLTDFKVDMRHLDAVQPAEKNCGTFYQNFWGERYVYRQTQWGPVRDDMPGALSGAKKMDELRDFDWPTPDMLDYSVLASQCRADDEFAILYGNADIWQRPSLVRGMENALCDLVINPEWVHFLSTKFTDFYKEDYLRAFRASRGRIDLYLIISDLGGQAGPLISVDMFDEYVAPYLKELTDEIHEFGAYVMFHSCGMVYPFIERLIDIGIDVLDPIQPVTPEMQPESLAAAFGDQICFHGGIDIQGVLPNGTTGEVEEEVRRYARVFGRESGGYICCPAHLFQPDIPPENIVAFYRALID